MSDKMLEKPRKPHVLSLWENLPGRGGGYSLTSHRNCITILLQ